MARSTRNLVRGQVERAAECQDSALEHLAAAEQLCEGRSTPVNKYMSTLVALIVEVKKVLLVFRSEL
jgi:hypothetical protein